jgi:putative ABC transport system substrate-binding protein
MYTRRKLIIALGAGALGVPTACFAQQRARVRRIGYFTLGTADTNADFLRAFREGMAEMRWVEGRDYVIDARYADGLVQAGPGRAAELVATQPDLLLTVTDESTRQLAQRTRTIPIVFAIGQDPVGNGFAAGLRRPGGNATGLTTLASDLGAKRLQLLKEAFPSVTHVVLLFDPTDAGSRFQVKGIEEAALRLGMRVNPIELRQAADIESAFKRGTALGAQAYMVAQSVSTYVHRQAITDRVARSKVPAIYADKLTVEGGGLMSYAPSFLDNFRRAAGYVDKILKGAMPGDLPIEQPIKYELVINLKTAKALGITIPRSVLVRANELIQ